jgi:hypothetical protein
MLESVHERLHELGAQLLNAHGNRDIATVAALKSEFEQQSVKLSNCIQQIQAEVLINTHTGKR